MWVDDPNGSNCKALMKCTSIDWTNLLWEVVVEMEPERFANDSELVIIAPTEAQRDANDSIANSIFKMLGGWHDTFNLGCMDVLYAWGLSGRYHSFMHHHYDWRNSASMDSHLFLTSSDLDIRHWTMQMNDVIYFFVEIETSMSIILMVMVLEQ